MIIKFKDYIKENNNKPEAIFLIGLPSSGKSTWIKKNIDSKFYSIICRDEIVEEVADDNNLDYNDMYNDNSEFIKSLNEIVSKLLLNQLFTALNQNQNIIIDMLNINKKSRKGFFKIINDYNYKIKAIVFEVDDIDLLKKVANKRSDELNDKYFKSETLDELKNRYTEPIKEEGFDEIVYINTTEELKKYLNE